MPAEPMRPLACTATHAQFMAKAAATAAQVDASRTMAADHLRLGKIGDWRNHFSSELEAAFRAKFAERMRGSGFECDIGDGEMLVAPN